MGTPGVPWVVTKEQLQQALKDHKGKISYVAKYFNVGYRCARRRIESDPELVQLMSDLRNEFEQTILDIAESTVAKTMTKLEEDTTNALKSAFFVLNSRGRERGWNNTLSEQVEITQKFDMLMNQIKELQDKKDAQESS